MDILIYVVVIFAIIITIGLSLTRFHYISLFIVASLGICLVFDSNNIYFIGIITCLVTYVVLFAVRIFLVKKKNAKHKRLIENTKIIDL